MFDDMGEGNGETTPAETIQDSAAASASPPDVEANPSPPEPEATPEVPAQIFIEDDEKPSDFGQMLAAYEKGRVGPPQGTVDPVVGQKVRGRIVSIGEEQGFVDFGGRSEGVIEAHFLRDDEGAFRFEVDDELDLFVIQAADQITLAPSMKADPRVALDSIRQSRASGIPVTGKVTGMNSGGLAVDLSGIRAFCPFSQIDKNFVADPSSYVGKTLDFLVHELDEARNSAVLSRRALLRRDDEEKSKRLLETLREGAELDGTVSRLEPFGAFVDLGGVDGLVHVSEIRYERTGHPSEALSEGQTVRVRVLRIETGKDGRPRIGLSIKAAAPDPWIEIEERFWKGRRVSGLVVRLTDFGAFVNLAPGIDGLVHVSEAAATPVAHVKECLEPNQAVEAVVLSVDPAKKRISLSIREALAQGAGGEGAAPMIAERAPVAGDVIDGFVAGIKPYGLFVDLPTYGHRTRGLVPREETGERPGADLTRRFTIGDKLKVEVLDVTDGKIRLSMAKAKDREEQAGFQAYARENLSGRAPATGMAEAFKKAMGNPKS